MDGECIIQGSTAIDDAESALRFAITALVADVTCNVFFAAAARALRFVHDIDEGTFTVVPFYPKNFITHCQLAEVRSRLLAASVLPVPRMSLVLRPWTCLVHADSASMQFRVSFEGIPPHVWGEDIAAKILAPSCWIHEVDLESMAKTSLTAFKLNA